MTSETRHYICRAKADGVGSFAAEFEAWRQDHAEAMRVCDVQDWIAEFLKETREAVSLVKDVRNDFFGGSIRSGIDELKTQVLRMFNGLTEWGAGLQELGRTFEAKGYSVDGKSALESSLGEMQAARTNFLSTWPRLNQAAWAATAADIKADAIEDVEDIIRELQGQGSEKHPPTDRAT